MSEQAERPWERPGAFRRDCEPYQGHVVAALSWAALGCAGLSLCLPPLCLAGLALGAVAVRLARRDLDRGRKGLFDPENLGRARAALDLATAALVAPIPPLAGWTLVLLALALRGD